MLELYLAFWESPPAGQRRWQGGGGGAQGFGAEAEDGVEEDADAVVEDLCAWPVITLDVLWHDPH